MPDVLNQVQQEFEELIKKVGRLRAFLTVAHLEQASHSLLTVEEDLIWQLHELQKFEAVEI